MLGCCQRRSRGNAVVEVFSDPGPEAASEPELEAVSEPEPGASKKPGRSVSFNIATLGPPHGWTFCIKLDIGDDPGDDFTSYVHNITDRLAAKGFIVGVVEKTDQTSDRLLLLLKLQDLVLRAEFRDEQALHAEQSGDLPPPSHMVPNCSDIIRLTAHVLGEALGLRELEQLEEVRGRGMMLSTEQLGSTAPILAIFPLKNP